MAKLQKQVTDVTVGENYDHLMAFAEGLKPKLSKQFLETLRRIVAQKRQ